MYKLMTRVINAYKRIDSLDRDDIMKKLNMFKTCNKITEEEYNKLIELMCH